MLNPIPLEAENWRIIQNPARNRWLLQFRAEDNLTWKTWKIFLTRPQAEKALKLILHYQ